MSTQKPETACLLSDRRSGARSNFRRSGGAAAFSWIGSSLFGNYRQERDAYLAEEDFTGFSEAGINWENVNKRILPQLIYKGHVLRRETLCRAGLFFVCPMPVYEEVPEGRKRDLVFQGQHTTTVEQLAYAFLSPGNLPPEDSYAKAIRAKIRAMGV